MAGCGVGAALQASPVLHGGGCVAATGGQGEAPMHSCASYTSSAVSVSCAASWASVRKNTSPPFSLASTNADSSGEVPEETRPTQPPERSLKVAPVDAQPAT